MRYADDFLLGFAGPKSAAKTLITHAHTEKARFLGYDVSVSHCDTKITGNRRSVDGGNRSHGSHAATTARTTQGRDGPVERRVVRAGRRQLQPGERRPVMADDLDEVERHGGREAEQVRPALGLVLVPAVGDEPGRSPGDPTMSDIPPPVRSNSALQRSAQLVAVGRVDVDPDRRRLHRLELVPPQPPVVALDLDQLDPFIAARLPIRDRVILHGLRLRARMIPLVTSSEEDSVNSR